MLFIINSKLIDPTTDRSSKPWGFFENNAELATIFLPHTGPLNQAIHSIYLSLGIASPMQNWEGFGYLGISVILITLFAIFAFFRKKLLPIPSPWNPLLVAAFILLIFSFCIPFRMWAPGAYLAEHLSFIRQFRAVGRFAWPFYFVLTILALSYLHHLTQGKKSLWIRSLPFIAAGLMLMEGAWENRFISNLVIDHRNPFLAEALPIEIDPSEYQAIITLPYFFIGPEYYIKEGLEELNGESLLLSYHSGLPLMSCMMSRTSISQTLKQTDLYERNLSPKGIRDDLNSDLPFLLLADPEHCSEEEANILSRAKKIGAYGDAELYAISKASLLHDERAEIIGPFMARSLPWNDGLYSMDSLAYVKSGSFEDLKNDLSSFQGHSAIQASANDFFTICTFSGDGFIPGNEYSFSIWMKGNMNSLPGVIIAIERDPSFAKENWNTLKGLHRFDNTRGSWHNTVIPFISTKCEEVVIVSQRPWYTYEELLFDKYLIRPMKTDVYEIIDAELWWNNIPLELDSIEAYNLMKDSAL